MFYYDFIHKCAISFALINKIPIAVYYNSLLILTSWIKVPVFDIFLQ